MSIFGNWAGGGGAWFSGDEQRRRNELLRQQLQQMQQQMQPFASASATAMMGISAWETPLLNAARELPVEMPAKIEPVALGELTNGMEQGTNERVSKWL